jgi:integrase
MLYKDLSEDHTIKEWLNSITQKKLTHRLYTFAMQYYTEFLGMTPEELLTEAETEIQAGVLPRQRKIKKHLLAYREHLQMQGFAPLTVKSRMTGVYSFYRSFDIELPTMPRNEKKAKPLQQHKEIPTKEDLQAILKHCDELERALLLIGASSGLASAEICDLTVGDFKKGFDPETGVTTLKLRREKVNFDFVTFLSPEASQAVLDYIDYRERELKPNIKNRDGIIAKQKIYCDSDFLLIRRKVPNEYLKTKNESLRQLTREGIIEAYKRLAEIAHKNTATGVWGLIRSHNIRKFFNSALLNAGADSFIVNFWMGHIQDDTRSAYFRASADNGLKDTYLKFVPYITIQKELDISVSPEYQRIKQENQVLQTETARHVVERSELQELREEIEKLNDIKEMFKNIEELSDERKRELKSEIKWLIENRIEQSKY